MSTHAVPAPVGSATSNAVALDARASGSTEQPAASAAAAAPLTNKDATHAVNGTTAPASSNGHTSATAPVKKLERNFSSAAAPGETAPPVHRRSPEESTNFLGRLFFWWLGSLVWQGYKEPLMDKHMYEVNSETEASHLSRRFESEWEVELKRSREEDGYQPRITRALYRIFKFVIWESAILKALLDGCQFLQPILLEWTLAFVAESSYSANPPPDWKGYVYAVFLGVVPFVGSILSNRYFARNMVMGLQIRTVLITQLYKKSLRLSPGARQSMSVGQIVNMMSTDATKIDFFCGYMHYLWSGPEQLIVSIALLVRAIGPQGLAGVAFIVLLIPFQAFVVKHLQNLRKATVKFTDRRVKLMNEILQGIRVIKVYAWEKSFLSKLASIREEEMRFVKKSAYTRAWNMTIMQAGPILMALLAFLTVALTADEFKAEYIFSSLVLFNLLRMPLMLLPMTIAAMSDARIGLQRIQNFLLAEELSSAPEYVQSDEYAMRVEQADFQWEKATAEEEMQAGMSIRQAADAHNKAEKAAKARIVAAQAAAREKAEGSHAPLVSPRPAPSVSSGDSQLEEISPFHLDNVDFTLPKGSLTVVVGAVGSGKSSLLAAILGEMKRTRGSVKIAGSVGYVPQQAWIQNATLRQNILFGLPFDQKRYDDAIKYCCLQADIDVLPARDLTEIGEKGINLSGGQKQRVNLARAVYFDADVVLLDDPLSAVDAHVSKSLFNKCICEKLANKTRLLVTHQLQYVSSCDQVLFVENGKITEAGTYQQLMRDKGRFFTLMSTYVGEEEEESVSSDEEAAVPSPSQVTPVEQADVAVDGAQAELAVPTGTGLVAHTDAPAAFASKAKGLKTARSSAGSRKASMQVDELTSEEKDKQRKAAQQLMQAEERMQGGVPLRVYLFYISQCGGVALVVLAFILLALQAATSSWTSWWLSLWTDDEYNQSVGWYLGIYTALGLGQCLWALLNTVETAYMGIVAAVHLHNKSFFSVLRAPMSFFDTTPIGRIINRFSKDQDLIDTMLMDSLRNIVNMAFNVLATLIMIIIVTPFFAVPLAPILVVYWFIQKMYRETSRELKRLESISRSPLFAHFSETLTGLATIRAYRAQDSFIAANVDRMNGNNRSYYLLVLSQRWLSLRVETIGALIAFFAALIIIIQRDSLGAGESGVSLSYAISVTSLLNWVVRQAVEAENSMNSVERSQFYTDSIEQEAPASVPEEDAKIEHGWPSAGQIQFKDLKIRYRQGLPLVLHGITLDIKGGERIGIVGRTGAGKSSLMVALFRIVEAAGGSIIIDGVDISKIGLDALRSKLAIIPQDPVLYSGTVRSNLDPFNQYTDEQLWAVLEKAYLKEAIQGLEKGLMDTVSENGENFSVGQRCQMCLARAMLRNAKVLIMDEATASVDMETDAFIQNSLRQHFDCTLLTIAHRLNTICDYDRVLVLSFGRVAEFDSPANLLRNPDSIFSSMVDETGEVNAALLRNIAFKAEKGVKVDIAEVLGAELPAEEAAILNNKDVETVMQSAQPQPHHTEAEEHQREESKVNFHDEE